MDKQLGAVRRRKDEKTASCKAKKKPIKVVYISNPMKFTTSASEFKALVQELTGQDSDPLLETAEFSSDGGARYHRPDNIPVESGSSHAASQEEEWPPVTNVMAPINRTHVPCEMLKEGFMDSHETVDGFHVELLAASSLFYELHELDILRSIMDAV